MKLKKEKDYITVYWAPATSVDDAFHGEINMMFPEPTNMFSYLVSRRSKFEKSRSIFVCPAFKDKMQKTFVFKNAMECNFLYETDDTGWINFTDLKNFPIPVTRHRAPGFDFGPSIVIETPYIFFADEDLEAVFSQPTFHEPGYTKYGTIVPGSFNIGSWFRPYLIELQMWKNSGELLIKEDEPLFYVEFLTKKKIKLVRFNYTKRMATYAQHCVDAPGIFGWNIPLIKRYRKFKESRMGDMILKEIKENIIGEFNEGQ